MKISPRTMENEAGTDQNRRDIPDDVLAARIADAIVELAREPGIHRLAAMQMAGLAGEFPAQHQLACAFGISRSEVRKIEARALAVLARRFPELRDELRRVANPVLPWHHGENSSSP